MKKKSMTTAPEPAPDTAAYWAACKRHELLIQRCAGCGHHQFYPRMLCVACGEIDVDWVRASGRGRVKSFTIVRRAVSVDYEADVPYVVALIALDEGPTMMSNIIGCAVDTVRIGQVVRVVFDDWSDEISVPKFTPVAISPM